MRQYTEYRKTFKHKNLSDKVGECNMSNLLHDLYDAMKRNEKEMLIGRSGSTPEGKNEKVRSGQSYLYKKYGMESEVIEIRFQKKVTGSLLNQALLTAMTRYPYFSTRLVEKDGDFYIVQNEQALLARRTKELARLGHISCGYHLIDITYYEYSIYISFHHALCDGRGIMPFVETLIYYYCDLKYGKKTLPEGVRLAGSPLLPGETADPFLQQYDFDQNKEFINLSRDAFAIPENVAVDERTNYRYEVRLPSVQYLSVCKKNNATPVILLALLMSRAITKLYPEYDKPINANIAAEYRALLAAQRDRDYCRKEANAMIGLSDKLDSLGSYEEKQKIMSFFEGMSLNTYIVSYLGKFNFGENAQYISDIHFYNSGTTGLGINMSCCGNFFFLDFKQNFPSDKYVKAFCVELEKLGIEYTASGKIPFITPGDSIIARK